MKDVATSHCSSQSPAPPDTKLQPQHKQMRKSTRLREGSKGEGDATLSTNMRNRLLEKPEVVEDVTIPQPTKSLKYFAYVKAKSGVDKMTDRISNVSTDLIQSGESVLSSQVENLETTRGLKRKLRSTPAKTIRNSRQSGHD